MADLALGLHGNLAIMMMVRALSVAVCVGLAHVMDLLLGVVGLIVKAQPFRWRTVPGTVLHRAQHTVYVMYSSSRQ